MLINSRSQGIDRLRQLAGDTRSTGEAMQQESLRFDRLKQTTSRPRVVAAFNLFQTPADIARSMAERLGDLDGKSVLEPSAGLGRLYHAVRERCENCPITLIDNSPACCQELYRLTMADRNASLQQLDFLQYQSLEKFDRIIMNPPFQRGTDIKHIQHAMTLLAPGGILVALCANGRRQNDILRPLATTFEPLPENSFRSEATAVSVALLKVFYL